MSNEDRRIGDLIHTTVAPLEDDATPSVVIVGSPMDEGVERNNGRTGARHAPGAIRKYLYKMTPHPDNRQQFEQLLGNTLDAGDQNPYVMEAMQHNLAAIAGPWLAKSVPVIILGGGHEVSYGHHLGYAESGMGHHIVNLDAHADVRPLKEGRGHSGSPFRQILEEENSHCLSYEVAGLQPQSVLADHIAYITNHGGSAHLFEQTDKKLIDQLYGKRRGAPVMVTFDMDAVDQREAPGVSAPCAHGLPKDLWLYAAFLAGKNPEVTSMDLVEVNPEYDRDEQTARLAALTVWYFMYGVALRENP